MPTRILTFNPLAEDELKKTEQELDHLLGSGWEIVSSIGGNRSGRQGGRGPLRTEREVAAAAPVSRDYIVLILHQYLERSASSKFNENEHTNNRLKETA
ncbi:MAG: hypothetical protein K8L97_30655 [Anaerolineae bacterium]|nr:hypothetical protein [Anaerolineae bacterium]